MRVYLSKELVTLKHARLALAVVVEVDEVAIA
jgi:hypothetical protein